MTDTLATIGFRADTRDLDQADVKLKKLGSTGEQTEKKINDANKGMSDSFRSSTAAVSALTAGLGALGAAVSISQIMKYSDQWTSYNNVLRQVTNTEQEFLKAQKDVLALAKQTNSNLQSTAELYGELSRATSELGLSSDRVLGVVGTINKLFLAGGKSAEEASGSIRQLSQALGAGALRGDEFNSVAEGAPRILDALAKQLNMTRGELREFAATGGITAEIMVAALESYSSEADKMVAVTKRTFAQTREVINANITQWVGSSKTLETATQAFSSAALSASENIEPLLNSVIAGATVMGGVWVVSAGQAAAATYGKIKADLESIAASNAAAIADKSKAVASAQAAIQEIALSKAEQQASIAAISSALQQITAEQQLEAVRMKAQISEIGRIHTATRMAELGRARALVAAQLTAAEASLLAIETRGAAATAALTTATGGLASAQAAATITSRALGASVAFMTGPWGILLTTVGAAAAAFYATKDSQIETAKTTKDLKGEIDGLTGSIDEMSRAQRDSLAIKVNERLLQLQAESKALKDTVELRKSVAGFDNKQIEEFSKLIGVSGVNAETLNAAATHAQASLDGLETETKTLNGTLEQLKTMSLSASVGLDKTALSAEESEKQLKRIAKAEQDMEDAFGGEDMLTEVYQNRAKAAEKLMDEWSEGVDTFDQDNKRAVSISEKAAERIEEAFADAWMNAFDGFSSVVDGMKNAFKRMLAEMAHMALTRPILISLGMGGMLPGVAGAAASGAVGGAAGGAMAGLGLLGGIGGGFVGAGGMIGGAFGSGLMGGGALLGAGQFGTMFSGAGSLLASGNIMAGLGMAMPLILGAGAALAGIQKLSGGGLFGTSYKTSGQSLGLSLGGGDITGSITTEESRKRSLFRGTKRRTSTSGYDASAIDDVFDAISESLLAAATTFGIEGADAVIKGFASSVNIDIKDKTEAEIQDAIAAWVGSTTEGLVNAVFGDSLDGLQKEGEGVIDTVNRLAMNMQAINGITDVLGLKFDLTGKAAMVAATNIVELAGGLEQLSALTSQYYSAFYSDAEQQANLVAQLSESFAALNVTMPDTREGFRALVDGLDLTSEAGQKMFAELMKLVPGMDQYLSALEAQRQASEEAAEAARKEAEAKAAALKAQGLDLQLRLYDALGQSAEALALRRQMELDATDETLRALLLQIYAAEDAAKAQLALEKAQADAAQSAAEAADAIARAAEALRSAAIDAAQNAFGKLQESAQREKDRLGTELDLKLESINAEKDLLKQQRDSVIDGYQEQGKAVEQYINKLEGLNDILTGFLSDTGTQANPFKELAMIYNEAKAGLLPESSRLSSVLSGVSGAGSAGFSSAFEQNRAMAVARNQAAGIQGIVGGAMGGAKSQLQWIEYQATAADEYYIAQLAKLDVAAETAQKLHDEQVGKIDEQLTEAQKQLNALLGVDDRLLTIDQALIEFYAAMNAANELGLGVASEQVAAINRVEAAIVQVGQQIVEIAKPDGRVWVPPTMPDRFTTDGKVVTQEMLDVLTQILHAQEATAKHTKTTADVVELNQYEAQEAAL